MNVTETIKSLEGRKDIDLGIKHNFSDGLYAKEMKIPQGYMCGTHCHKYSHLSILGKGKVIVKTDNSSQEYTAPACINIEADVIHMILALEDSVWYCIHATEETNIDNIDETLIMKEGT
jgi:quercetin dioxygenase-like cupin family protein